MSLTLIVKDPLPMCLRIDDRSTHSSLRLSLAAGRVILLICFLLSAAAYALPPPGFLPKRENRVVHKQIETLEMEWRQAQVDNNITVIADLLADDYVGITANGTIETKSQAIAQRKAGTIRITTLDLDDLKVRLYGDTAVVTSNRRFTGRQWAKRHQRQVPLHPRLQPPAGTMEDRQLRSQPHPRRRRASWQTLRSVLNR